MSRRAQFTGGGGGGVAAHNILSATHLDSVPAAPVQGDLIAADNTPAWARLARGLAYQALLINPAGTDPAWGPITLDQAAALVAILPEHHGGVANIQVAGQGGFWGGIGASACNHADAAVGIVGVANRTYVMQFVLPYRSRITNIIFGIDVAAAGLCDFGIYDAPGTAKLLSTGPQATNVVGYFTVAIAPVTLDAGVYWFAWGANNIGCAFKGIAVQRDQWSNIINRNTVHWGWGANPLVAGTLPATIGALTAGGWTAIPAVWFEP